MAQYPNYLNPLYQPQTNYPQYGYQPMQMDRMAQLQQFQQSLHQPQGNLTPIGKIVESVDIVKATDIPMDGNMYYFPKADGTEIFAKQWMPNGQTRILSFKAILDEEIGNSSQNTFKADLGGIQEFTEVLESKLNDLYERIVSSKQPKSVKKEVNADE